jgi:chromosome segregation ATPase
LPVKPLATTISSVTSIARATEQAIAQLKSAAAQIETGLRSRAEEYRGLLEAAEKDAERGGSEKSIEEDSGKFRTETREWFEEARQELRGQLEASRASFEAELKKNQAELLEAARQKIEAMAQAPLEAKAQASSEADQWEIARRLKEQADASQLQADAGAQELARATEQGLARLREAEEKIETALSSQVESCRRTVAAAVADLRQKGTGQASLQDVSEEIQRMTEQVFDHTAKRIEERTEQAVSAIGEKLAAAQNALEGAVHAWGTTRAVERAQPDAARFGRAGCRRQQDEHGSGQERDGIRITELGARV